MRPTGTLRTVGTIAVLTVLEAARRRVLLALAVLTAVLIGISAWGFSRLAAGSGGSLTVGEDRLTASIVLNLVMFGLSLIAALGTAFLAGPTLAGETDSGISLAVLARPIRRSTLLVGKWVGLAAVGTGYVVAAGTAQCLVVRQTVGYWPSRPLTALVLLATQTVVLLTLALLLSTAISSMASGVVAVGLFGATWIAGVIGGIGDSLGNVAVGRVGDVSRVLLPTDGLWRAAMHALQDQPAIVQFAGDDVAAFPFLSVAPPGSAYLVWVAAWIATTCGVTAAAFARTDL